MILEALNFAATWIVSKRRKAGEINSSVRLRARAGRCARDWAEHEENCKAFVNRHMPDRGRVAVVLGSGLLRDLPLVEKILTGVRQAISIPLTCKFRAGWNDKELVHVRMAQLAEDCGVAAVALHPRTREQGYSGSADWTRIGEVKAGVKIPVIGNGDIITPQAAEKMFDETGCAGVSIGRGAFYDPWIFRRTREYLKRGTGFQPVSEIENENADRQDACPTG